MKSLKYFYPLILILAISLVSCERDFESDILTRTPPALEVVVRNASNAQVVNATIRLYKDEPTWNMEGSPLVTKQTNAEGRVVFTADELKDPGFVYLITTNGALKVKSKTKYLLLNDGASLYTISLK